MVLGNKNKTIQYITPLQDKIEMIEKLKVDYLFVVRFTAAFASLEPEQFTAEYLTKLNVHHAIAGFDFTYGKFGKGTMETLPLHSNDSFDVTTIAKIEANEQKISSTEIRRHLNEGAVNEIKSLLGCLLQKALLYMEKN